MYWKQSHRFLSRTPLKTRVKRKINYPFKWIQSNGNWVVYFKKFDNFRLIHLSWTCSTFHPTFFYSLTYEIWICLRDLIHNHVRDLDMFLQNIYQKWKYHREEKQGFERFLIFVVLKCRQI